MRDLTTKELREINGGDFWDSAFTIYKTIVKYSSLTGALIVGIGDGILEAIDESKKE